MENTNQVVTQQDKNVSISVMKRINELTNKKELVLPHNYIPENALKSAWLIISQDKKMMACSQTSIAQCLTDMVIQGLNPGKKQCYFIPYGVKENINGKWETVRTDLTLSRSYFGEEVAVKNCGLLTGITPVVIYKNDKIEIGFDDLGKKIVKTHETSFENLDNEILGAYAIGYYPNGNKIYEIMTMKEIKKAWGMSSQNKYKKDSTDKNTLQDDFTQEACKRTVIRRLVKRVFNTSTDENLVIEAYNNTTDREYLNAEATEVKSEEYKHQSTSSVHEEQKKEETVKVDSNGEIVDVVDVEQVNQPEYEDTQTSLFSKFQDE